MAIKRLACEIPLKLHEQLKKKAKKKNITLTRYVIRALLRYSMFENKYEDSDEHKQVSICPKIKRRI